MGASELSGRQEIHLILDSVVDRLGDDLLLREFVLTRKRPPFAPVRQPRILRFFAMGCLVTSIDIIRLMSTETLGNRLERCPGQSLRSFQYFGHYLSVETLATDLRLRRWPFGVGDTPRQDPWRRRTAPAPPCPVSARGRSRA